MELQELYQGIHLQPQIVDRLNQVQEQIDLDELLDTLDQMLDRKTAAVAYQNLCALFREDVGHFQMLYCQLECARRIFDRYQQKQISKRIYLDTMKCFPRFLEECQKKHGQMFFDRGWWTYRQTSMELFRIGALEYQFAKYKGAPAIALHIPSDADLTKESVDDSLEQAGIFFDTYYTDYKYDTYTCDSWLLSPVLEPLLDGQSHILSFQKRFLMMQEDEQNNEYIEWLFQVPKDTEVQKLPVHTSLQRKVKELLMRGGAVGSAYGVMQRSSWLGGCRTGL